MSFSHPIQRAVLACLATASLVVAVPAGASDAPLPTFAELEAQGAIIGRIDVRSENIFDTEKPEENNALFRLANRLHIQTKPETILRALLFKRGQRISARVIEETERQLRGHNYLYDVRITPLAVRNGIVDIEVAVRDTWTLEPNVRASRTGGRNTTGFGLREQNLLGTGVSVSLAHKRDVDRSSNTVEVLDEHAFGGHTNVAYSFSDNSDGRRHAASVVRPFYELDARWAAGASIVSDDRIDPLYANGKIATEYRHKEVIGDVFAGWSRGLVDGWTQRYSIGLRSEEQRYRQAPDRVATPGLPGDQIDVAPYFRLELIEDNFERTMNRNQVRRTEYFQRGLTATMQIGRAMKSLGSTDDRWIYSASLSRGFSPVSGQDLFANASLSGRYGNGKVERQAVGAAMQYYAPIARHWLAYGSLTVDALTRPAPGDLLTLGGDTGLRGFPLRFQTGEHRALMTLEARAYSDIYVFSLFRLGAAVFYDIGSVWGGQWAEHDSPEWLQDVGIGLRIFSTRSAQGTVLHADVATPINRPEGAKGVQFLLKTRTSF